MRSLAASERTRQLQSLVPALALPRLTGSANVVPPRRQERVVTPGDLLRQNVDALVVERREPTQQRVEHATESPHVDALAVPLVLDDLGRRVADRTARGHRLLVPDDLGETEIGNLDASDPSAADTR